METIDKLLILAGTLEVCMDRISSGHTEDDKLRMNEKDLGDLWGCTNPQAINYNSKAIYDDGSCILVAAEPPEG